VSTGNESALKQAKANPQAYACLGLTIFSGSLGLFFGFFLTDVRLRLSIAGACFILFVAGIFGHGYFTRRAMSGQFLPSRSARLLLAIGFGMSILGALAFAGYVLYTGDYVYAVIPIVYAAGMSPFVRKLFKGDEKQG
jgi:hypothetical protein